ncbi:MAG: zinc ribbon domain-containing protein [Betaproteobacteria bacterium]|nr:MAG: zinc ribbon domain-containing protein [Betaproteobacteria bacterium]
MPIYEYRCSSCGFQKEYLQKLSDPVLTDCPECGKQTFSKMLSAAGFQLKGSGWYATDFRNSGAKPAAKTGGTDKSDTKTDAKAGAKSDTKSDTKSDVKSDTKPDKKSESKSESKSEAVGSGAGVRS